MTRLDLRLLRHHWQLLALGSNTRKTLPHYRRNPLRRHRLRPLGRLQERCWKIHWSLYDRLYEFGGHPVPRLSNVSEMYCVVLSGRPALTELRSSIASSSATVSGATASAIATGGIIALANCAGAVAPYLFRAKDA